jgi:hypothetical protein
MNTPIISGSSARSYKRKCADCLLQGTPNAPPSPAPRTAAFTESQRPPGCWLFPFGGPIFGFIESLAARDTK